MPPNSKNNDNHRIAGTLRSSLSHFSFHQESMCFSALTVEKLRLIGPVSTLITQPVDTHKPPRWHGGNMLTPTTVRLKV